MTPKLYLDIDRIRAKNATGLPVAPAYHPSVLKRPVWQPPPTPFRRPTYSAPGCTIRSPLDEERLA